jgi:hypothetical protein
VYLDDAIKNLGIYIIGQVPDNSLIAIINISYRDSDISNYVIDELPNYILNNPEGPRIIDRQRIDVLQKELKFQMSGDVDDESMQAIGKMLGAQYIITGSIHDINNILRLNVKIITVKTAEIIGSFSCELTLEKPKQIIVQQTQGNTSGYSNNFTDGFYIGYVGSMKAPFGFSIGGTSDSFGIFWDNEFNFPNFAGYDRNLLYSYDADGKINSSYSTNTSYIYRGKSTSFAWETILGTNYNIWYPYLWLVGGLGLRVQSEYRLYDKKYNYNIESTEWYKQADEVSVKFVVSAGLFVKISHIYLMGRFKYTVNAGPDFDAGIGYVWEYY